MLRFVVSHHFKRIPADSLTHFYRRTKLTAIVNNWLRIDFLHIISPKRASFMQYPVNFYRGYHHDTPCRNWQDNPFTFPSFNSSSKTSISSLKYTCRRASRHSRRAISLVLSWGGAIPQKPGDALSSPHAVQYLVAPPHRQPIALSQTVSVPVDWRINLFHRSVDRQTPGWDSR